MENTDNKEDSLFRKLSDLNKGRKSLEKISFLSNVKIFAKSKRRCS